MPSFRAAGAGNVEAPISGTLQVAYPSGITAGQFLLLHVVAQDPTTPAITTPSGWTLIDGRFSTDLTTRSACYWKLASGSESGNLDITATASTFAAGRIYAFNGGNGVEAASGALTDATGTAMLAVNVTTTAEKRRAVQVMFANGNTTIGDLSGETGTDYTEAVAEYASATGPVIFSLQTGSVPSATAISGGSATLGATSTYRARHGFAITP